MTSGFKDKNSDITCDNDDCIDAVFLRKFRDYALFGVGHNSTGEQICLTNIDYWLKNAKVIPYDLYLANSGVHFNEIANLKRDLTINEFIDYLKLVSDKCSISFKELVFKLKQCDSPYNSLSDIMGNFSQGPLTQDQLSTSQMSQGFSQGQISMSHMSQPKCPGLTQLGLSQPELSQDIMGNFSQGPLTQDQLSTSQMSQGFSQGQISMSHMSQPKCPGLTQLGLSQPELSQDIMGNFSQGPLTQDQLSTSQMSQGFSQGQINMSHMSQPKCPGLTQLGLSQPELSQEYGGRQHLMSKEFLTLQSELSILKFENDQLRRNIAKRKDDILKADVTPNCNHQCIKCMKSKKSNCSEKYGEDRRRFLMEQSRSRLEKIRNLIQFIKHPPEKETTEKDKKKSSGVYLKVDKKKLLLQELDAYLKLCSDCLNIACLSKILKIDLQENIKTVRVIIQSVKNQSTVLVKHKENIIEILEVNINERDIASLKI